MSFLGAVAKKLSLVGGLLKRAWKLAEAIGLDDALIATAIPLVRKASDKYVDNTDRREWVVKELSSIGVKESIARIATELAYRMYRKELEKQLDKL